MRVLKRFFENDEKIFVLYHESFLYSQCDLVTPNCEVIKKIVKTILKNS